MILESISNGSAVFVLSADDCTLLVKALAAADPASVEIGQADTLLAMEAAFKGAALCGLMQWNMHVQDLEASDKAIRAAGLLPEEASTASE